MVSVYIICIVFELSKLVIYRGSIAPTRNERREKMVLRIHFLSSLLLIVYSLFSAQTLVHCFICSHQSVCMRDKSPDVIPPLTDSIRRRTSCATHYLALINFD